MKKIFYFLQTVLILCLAAFSFSCNQVEEPTPIYVDKAPTEHCLGYKTLEPTDNFITAVSMAKMIYIINDEFDLNAGSVTIPDSSILVFGDNGKIINGTVTFSNTYLDGKVKFKNVSFAGTLLNKTVNLSWFGATTDLNEEKTNKKNNSIITQVLNCMGDTLIVDGYYPVSSKISVTRAVNLRSPDWNESLCKKTYSEDSYVPSNGFYTNGEFSLIEVISSINLYGIRLTGNVSKYKTATAVPTSGYTFGLKTLEWSTGSIAAVYNCRIEGFTQGLRAVSGFIEKIQNTTFDSCVTGLYVIYASDFDIFGCRFTNCMPNLSVPAVSDSTFTDSNLNTLRECGCGIILEGCGMVNFANNLLENNFINLQLLEADIIINITDCTFKNPGFCDLYLFNDYAPYSSNLYFNTGENDLQKICMDNIVIHQNTFERSSKAVGRCIVLLKNRQKALASDNTTVVTHDRITNFVFSNNTIKDTRSNVGSNDSIFTIKNEDETKSRVTCTGNNFTNSKVRFFINAILGSTGKYSFKNKNNSMPTGEQPNSVHGATGIISFK
ncbi:MAG: hypothetical protein K6E97_07985 [Treponema sp.]|nr:hypothetical protein [Treponema sp.]